MHKDYSNPEKHHIRLKTTTKSARMKNQRNLKRLRKKRRKKKRNKRPKKAAAVVIIVAHINAIHARYHKSLNQPLLVAVMALVEVFAAIAQLSSNSNVAVMDLAVSSAILVE